MLQVKQVGADDAVWLIGRLHWAQYQRVLSSPQFSFRRRVALDWSCSPHG